MDVERRGKGGWGGEGAMEAETTAERGGRDRGCDADESRDAVAVVGRLLLDPGRPSRDVGREKLNGLGGRGRKDCEWWWLKNGVEEVVGGIRKDWVESRKE